MTYVKNAAAILGLLVALNTLLALAVDRDSAMGRFYEELWHRDILGRLARSGTYDPFAAQDRYFVFSKDNLSNIARDYEAIRQVAGTEVYVASHRQSYNGDKPQGVLAFANDLNHARQLQDLMSAAIREAKPKIDVQVPDGATVLVSSGSIGIHRVNDLEMFCRDYRTYEPERLCF